MTLAEFTCPGLIVPRLLGNDATTVIQELSLSLRRENRVPDLLRFYHAVLNREFLVSSDWETGLAFPHARLPELNQLSLALGRSDKPIVWNTRSLRPVQLVFLIAVPEDSIQYLSLVAGIVRLSKEKSLLERLRTAQDSVGMLEVLRKIKLSGEPKPIIKSTR